MLIAIEAAHANKTPRTGVEWYCYQVIQELKKIIPSDVRVVLYSNTPLRDGIEVLPPNWEVRVLRWPFRKGWSQFRLSWELFWHRPDVYFAPGQLTPWYSPKNTITTVHDSAFMADAKSYWWGSRWYLRLMNRLIINKSNKILVSAEFNKKELLKYYGEDFAKKVEVVPLAYDSEKYQISNDKFPIKSKLQISKPYLLSIGRLEEKKNTARIVEAFEKIKNYETGCEPAIARIKKPAANRQLQELRLKIESLKLVLVGIPGVGYEKIKQVIDYSPYHDDIVRPGYVSAEALPGLLANAEVFVFPSLYEGFGMPVLEAMAVGCPVVAADNTALPEVGGDAALYADPQNSQAIADQIMALLGDNDLRSAQIKAGLERVKQYSWAKTAALTWQEIGDCQK